MTNELVRASESSVLTIKDVFGDWSSGYLLRGIDSWDQVAILGRGNLTKLVAEARKREGSFTTQISALKDKQNVLRGKSGTDFIEAAKEFENPVITQIGEREGNWSNDPEPLDVASTVRAGGTTTFNMCGWCKHASGSTCRYSYAITSHCSLMDCKSSENRFNTPCHLQKATAIDISSYVGHMEVEIEKAQAERELVRAGIRLLQQLKRRMTTDKPYLMSLRPYDGFNVGDELMVYIGKYENKIVEGDWVPAICVFGYRHQDGCVSYQALFPIHDNLSNFEGRGGGAGDSRPEVMSRSTFCFLNEAFESDPEFLELWIKNTDRERGLEGYDPDAFREALRSGIIAQPPADWEPPTDEIPVKTVKDAERVLQCLDASLFKTEADIRSWAKMQLRYVQPDKLASLGNNAKTYAERQTRAVYAARDLLIARL